MNHKNHINHRSDVHPTFTDVYFDDVKMTYVPTAILQYNEYYPFGLQTSTSWTRENSNNNFLGNGGSEMNATSGLYDTYYRGYDPALGRFLQVDPLATSTNSMTPYHYAGNNPVMFNDPNGDRLYVSMEDLLNPPMPGQGSGGPPASGGMDIYAMMASMQAMNGAMDPGDIRPTDFSAHEPKEPAGTVDGTLTTNSPQLIAAIIRAFNRGLTPNTIFDVVVEAMNAPAGTYSFPTYSSPKSVPAAPTDGSITASNRPGILSGNGPGPGDGTFWSAIGHVLGFITGMGNQINVYGPNSPESKAMNTSPGIDEAVALFYSQGKTVHTYEFSPNWKDGDLTNTDGALDRHSQANNPITFTTGGYTVFTSLRPDGSLNIMVGNTMSANSLFGHLGDLLGININYGRMPMQTAPLSNTYQFYIINRPGKK